MTESGDFLEQTLKNGMALSSDARRPSRTGQIGRRNRILGCAPASARARRERLLRLSRHAGSSWDVFVEKFEKFTHLLCTAAQHGTNEHIDAEYMSLRSWFLAHYYDHSAAIRANLVHESPEPDGGTGDGSYPMDPFEAIFLPRTIQELLAHDDGNLISMISWISHAVYSVDVEG